MVRDFIYEVNSVLFQTLFHFIAPYNHFCDLPIIYEIPQIDIENAWLGIESKLKHLVEW